MVVFYTDLDLVQENAPKPTNRKFKKQRIETVIIGSTSSEAQTSSPMSNIEATLNILDSKNIDTVCVEQQQLVSELEESSYDQVANFSPATKTAIQQLQKETHCPIIQNKWHRRYGPPNSWDSSPPSRGTEIFVGRIPRDLFEDELVPVLQKAGTVYEVRLMMENCCTNRGFAYVKYATKGEADTAVKILNGFEIRERQFLGVMKSVDNNRLFIGGIPKNRCQEELLQEINRLTDEVLNVILYSDVNDKSKNRGFAFVEYKNHAAASAARQKLLKNPPLLWGCSQVKVDWAEPEREVDEQTMSKVRILYVRNLALQTTEQSLKDLFSSLGANIERVKKLKDYAFIHFASREEAEEAKEKYQGTILDGCRIDISWSKPVANREEYQQRKAASKAMLSGINSPLVSPLGPHSDHVLVGARVRTAAGAQGYSVARPYPPSRPKSETSVNALQQASVIMTNPYLSNIALRNTIEQIGVPSFTPVMYTTDRVSAVEETILAAPADMHCHYGTPPTPLQRIQPWVTPQLMNIIPQIPNGWATQQYVPQQISPPAPSVVQYVIPQGLVLDNQYGAYSCPQIIPGHMMTQIPSISGSNMSIDRT